MKISMVILSIAACVFCGMAAFGDDPYDPVMGGRNARPGAEKYLEGVNDIPSAEKHALLGGRPCSSETLEKLADAPAREVRSLVAQNPAASESLLNKLSVDKETGVRQYVASNRNASHALLVKLHEDSDEEVKWSVEHNPAWTK